MLSHFERPRDAVPSAFEGATFVSEKRGCVYLCVSKARSSSADSVQHDLDIEVSHNRPDRRGR